MNVFLFPGQGAQFSGMGKGLYDSSSTARKMFKQANEILGWDIDLLMFEGTEDELKQTRVTQPAIFIHSVITALVKGQGITPEMVAGHSLGEFSALTVAGVLSFEDALLLVNERALAMQDATDETEGTMAAILGLEDEVIEQVCGDIDDVVVAANYNSPGQLVISGSITGVETAVRQLSEAGARRALVLNVGGAFHSPLMESAEERLAEAIEELDFNRPICPIYQNVTARATIDPDEIQENLISQLTSPVRWKQTMEQMLADGGSKFYEVGGKGGILQGMLKKVDRNVQTFSL